MVATNYQEARHLIARAHALAEVGHPPETIAEILGIDLATLARYLETRGVPSADRVRYLWAREIAEQIAAGNPPDVPDRWWEHGSCRSVGDPDAWFPVGAPDPAVIRTCDACPVQTACLTVALTRPERDGVWGGITHRHLLSLHRRIQRIRMHRRGYRARPWHSKREGAA